MEMPYGRSEEDTLPDIEKKSPAVGQVRLHLECRGEAVDEGTLVQQGRPVIKEPAVPVYPLITGQRGQSGIEVAMAFGVPVSILMQFLQTLVDTAYSGPMHTVDKLIEEGGKDKQIIWIHWLCGILTFVMYLSLTFVALYFGNEVINVIVNNLPAWMTNGLNAVAKVLPALGFALLMNLLLEQDLIPYLIIGFALTAWLGMSMIGVAAVSVALAWIIYLLKRDQLNSASEPEEEEL